MRDVGWFLSGTEIRHYSHYGGVSGESLVILGPNQCLAQLQNTLQGAEVAADIHDHVWRRVFDQVWARILVEVAAAVEPNQDSAWAASTIGG